jgi:pimeloyl-ACP methyl ester carboxylesterase
MDDIGRIPEWFVIGGSYPGALAAWLKATYPDHVVGAWTSSAVISPSLLFQEFDSQLYHSTLKSGELCPETI